MSPALTAYLTVSRLAGAVVPAMLRRRAARGREDPVRLPERLGHAGAPRPQGRLVWVHGASVGETGSALALIGALLDAGVADAVLVTAGTRGAAAFLADRLPPGAFHQYAPVDTAGAVARFLDHWRPDLALWMESEIWPRMIADTAARGIPMALVNARLSEKSLAGWQRVPGMARALFGAFRVMTAQDARTGDRLQALGAPAPLLTGNLKTLQPLPDAEPRALAAWQAAVAGRPVWLAASTHAPEEEAALDAHAAIVRETGRADLLTVIAPRHPGRAAEIAAAAETRGLTVARRSDAAWPEAGTAVYLADSLGEMGLWYRAIPLAFVGGSLAPKGGHNPFEPAEGGAAIVHGPSTENFAGAYGALASAQAAVAFREAPALGPAIAGLLRDPGGCAAMARKAAAVCEGLKPDLTVLTRALGAMVRR